MRLKWLNEVIDIKTGKLPFKFNYGGECSHGFLDKWDKKITEDSVSYFEDKKNGGLAVNAEIKVYDSCPAFDLKITLENTGKTNTKIIDGFSTLDFDIDSPLKDGSYVIHKAMGGLTAPEDFVQSDVIINDGEEVLLETAGGRSSNKDLPFFRIDAGKGNIIIAIGWTGQWKCEIKNAGRILKVAAGMENSHFVMYSGEKFSLGSMVVLFWDWEGDSCESNNAFRKLLLDEYIPEIKSRGKEIPASTISTNSRISKISKMPYLFCNTCFTRGGGWLNECNEKNQISLINALKPLHCESVITDAGWFKGGWPFGAGNWDPDPEKYPRGFKPVSDASKSQGMKYGLWFELERVVANTELAETHGDWLLRAGGSDSGSLSENEHMLLNLGIPEAVDYIYKIVEDKLNNDGIECYRQDFNMDPLVYWRNNDAEDRAGITEIKYINGLYGYLDRIRINYPGIFMDGCSSGGRRIDIETLKRFHTHQKTDLWFNPTVDQNSLFSLSHYIPNVSFTAHVNRYDDYSFNSAMAATLCLGWIADSDDEYMENGKFEFGRATQLIERYEKVRPYLNCSFYPLTPPNEREDAVIAFEFYDKDSDSGVIFVFARKKCETACVNLEIKGLKNNNSDYILTDLTTCSKTELRSGEYKHEFTVNIENPPFSAIFKFELSENNMILKITESKPS